MSVTLYKNVIIKHHTRVHGEANLLFKGNLLLLMETVIIQWDFNPLALYNKCLDNCSRYLRISDHKVV